MAMSMKTCPDAPPDAPPAERLTLRLTHRTNSKTNPPLSGTKKLPKHRCFGSFVWR